MPPMRRSELPRRCLALLLLSCALTAGEPAVSAPMRGGDAAPLRRPHEVPELRPRTGEASGLRQQPRRQSRRYARYGRRSVRHPDAADHRLTILALFLGATVVLPQFTASPEAMDSRPLTSVPVLEAPAARPSPVPLPSLPSTPAATPAPPRRQPAQPAPANQRPALRYFGDGRNTHVVHVPLADYQVFLSRRGPAPVSQLVPNGTAFAVNASFFDGTSAPLGRTVSSGQVWTDAFNQDRVDSLVCRGAKCEILAPMSDAAWAEKLGAERYETAVSGFRLVWDGAPQARPDGCPADVCNAARPRTAVGVTRDGTTLVVLATQHDVTVADLAELTRQHGVWRAILLDGGSSTAAHIGPQLQQAASAQGKPITGTFQGRAVANALGILPRAAGL